MRERVLDELRTIERRHDVRILYACESGSRAWGFESPNSDYDVRFIYARRPDDYLSIDIEDRRDVIEQPADELLDVNGWDLRKALRLLRKSNPPLLEWLRSPIVYYDLDGSGSALRAVGEQFARKAGVYHYWHMARGNFRDYLQGDEVWTKKYLYVVRPLLAARWVLERGTPPPVEMDSLVAEMVTDDPGLRAAIDALVARKRAGEELDAGPRDDVLDEFIVRELVAIEHYAATLEGGGGPPLPNLNRVFRSMIYIAWEAPSGLAWGAEGRPSPDTVVEALEALGEPEGGATLDPVPLPKQTPGNPDPGHSTRVV